MIVLNIGVFVICLGVCFGIDLGQWKHYMSVKLQEEDYKKKFG